MTSLAKRVSNDIIERLKNNDLIMPHLCLRVALRSARSRTGSVFGRSAI